MKLITYFIAIITLVPKLASGRRYGNKVADCLGISRSIYHAAMEEGGMAQHMLALYSLKHSGATVAEVCVHSCKYLDRGLDKLELRFGTQAQITNARYQISALLGR